MKKEKWRGGTRSLNVIISSTFSFAPNSGSGLFCVSSHQSKTLFERMRRRHVTKLDLSMLRNDVTEPLAGTCTKLGNKSLMTLYNQRKMFKWQIGRYIWLAGLLVDSIIARLLRNTAAILWLKLQAWKISYNEITYTSSLVEFPSNMSASWVFVALSRITWVTPDIVSCASAVLGSLNIEENVRWKVLLDCESKT